MVIYVVIIVKNIEKGVSICYNLTKFNEVVVLKKGLILTNSFYNPKSYYNQGERLKEEFNNRGIEIDLKKNNFFAAYVTDKGELENLASGYDFCVYLDKDKYISEMLEKQGLRLFNNHEAIRVCDDKMQTFIRLSNCGINLPKTLSAPLCYDKNAEIDESFIVKVEKFLGYPVIVKECYGSLGKNVYMAQNRTELMLLADKLKLLPHLFQKAVKTSMGKDVRVIIIGKRKVFSMLRESKTDFRSNVELGGKSYKYSLNKEWKDFAIKIAEILNLDYCGIDILFGENGQPVLCEVNSNAFFGGMEKTLGENVAAAYADYIMQEIYK